MPAFIRRSISEFASSSDGAADMAKPQQTCGFCHGLGMTKQHIFGKRLLRLLENHVGRHLVVERLPTTTTSKERDGNVWSRQVRKICLKCNNGWMEQLENETYGVLSNIILGNEFIVPDFFHNILAARLSLIAMAAALSMTGSIDTITETERRYLMTHQSPPAHWNIFLCRADIPFEIAQYYNANVFGYRILGGRNPPELGMSYIATFVMGKLCVHLMTRAPPGYNGYTGVRLLRLWPAPGGDLDLRIGSALDAVQVHELADSIRRRSLIDSPTFPFNRVRRNAGLS
jgi:hypothetical protein